LIDTTGKPFAELMREMVLVPLGMELSTFEQPLPTSRQAEAASAHSAQGAPIAGRWHIYPEQGAAGLWTTPSDMARYAIEVQLAHEGKSHKVLSRDMTDKMLVPQGGGPVGLGPFLVERGTTRRFEHGGGNEGFNCQFVADLDRGQGAVVMTNSDSGRRAVNETINAIASVYGWPDYLPPEREAARIDAQQLDRFVGEYALNVAAVATIARHGDCLVVRLAGRPEIEMYPQSSTAFITETPDVQGRAELDDEGHVVAVVFDFAGREVRAKRVP
jgi:hypothetical protein